MLARLEALQNEMAVEKAHFEHSLDKNLVIDQELQAQALARAGGGSGKYGKSGKFSEVSGFDSMMKPPKSSDKYEKKKKKKKKKGSSDGNLLFNSRLDLIYL